MVSLPWSSDLSSEEEGWLSDELSSMLAAVGSKDLASGAGGTLRQY